MGADAEVFIFDYQAYNNEVVPAFRELLLSGQMPEWLQRLIEAREMQPERWRGTDLLRYCTYLDLITMARRRFQPALVMLF
jgi:hypothetical protein